MYVLSSSTPPDIAACTASGVIISLDDSLPPDSNRRTTMSDCIVTSVKLSER